MTEALKMCPFCGGMPRLHIYRGDYGYSADEYTVKCTSCGATIQRSFEYEDMTGAVTEAWNRRAKL